jgi:hypothetical protein
MMPAKQRRGGAIQRAIAPAGHLMQRPHCQAAARQPCIHRRQPERQNPIQPPIPHLQTADFCAQLIDGGKYPHFAWYPRIIC